VHGQPPIVIEPYDPAWPARFESERGLLEPVLATWIVGPIEHIGSTAVPGLPAKPVIDIMAPVRDIESSRPAIDAVWPLGYWYWFYKGYHWFCKPCDQERTHHLHLIPIDYPRYREVLAFRDYLRNNPDTAREYAELKLRLAEEFRDDREAYTEAKTEFVVGVLEGLGKLKGNA
jgi:GrpB-like predicted nucleotidyltransferase (UPF0157 family)